MTGLCRGLLRNADEAEDASQQAFLSAHGAFLRGAEPRDPGAWLTTIARNECLARIRERMRRPLPVADADAAVSSSDPVLEATRRADMAALWQAIRTLAPQQREAMLLREFGGLSYDELAVALGVSVPAVESLLFRARTKLRLELKAIAAAAGGLLPRLLAGGSVAKVAGLTVAAGLVTGGVVATDRVPHTPPAPRPHHLIVVPTTVQRPHAVVVVRAATTQSPAKEDRSHTDDVAAANDTAERGDDRNRATVVEPAETTSTPALSADGGGRDMSGDATTVPATIAATTTTTAATTTESGHDGGTDGSSGDGGSSTTTTSSSDGPHS